MRFYLMVLALAITAAGLTVFIGATLMPESLWVAPATMAALASLALFWHLWVGRK